jgi:DNA-binding response OmpR family regulator
MLTCKSSLEDKVKGLDSGADDYLVKPFEFEELYARVRALLRRERTALSTHLILGNIGINLVTKEVRRDGKPLNIIGKEYAILEYLVRHKDAPVTRTMIEEHIWNIEATGNPNLVEVYISKLRSKLDEDGQASLIQYVRGAGYRIKGL